MIKGYSYTPAAQINEQLNFDELTPGGVVFEACTSRLTKTGEWRTETPIFLADKCKQCLLCVPACPDMAIPVKDGKRGEFNLDYCKGCGVCSKACPFDAIEFGKEGK